MRGGHSTQEHRQKEMKGRRGDWDGCPCEPWPALCFVPFCFCWFALIPMHAFAPILALCCACVHLFVSLWLGPWTPWSLACGVPHGEPPHLSTFYFSFPFRMLSFVFVVRCARTRRPCTSSRLDVQQEHEQCGVDDHAVYGTYFRHEEGSFFVRMDLQVFGFSLPSPSISHRLALASFRACQAQLLDPRRVHLPCIPRGGRVRRLPRLPTPSSQLHGHATQPRPRLRRPCDVRFAMTSGMAIVHVHRHVRTCDTVSKVHPRVRKGRSKGNRALSRKKKPERSADERKNRRRDAAGSFFSEARQGGRADPPCHVGMAVEKEGDRTVPCVNLLHSYDMRSSVHDRAPKGQGSARIRVPQRCP